VDILAGENWQNKKKKYPVVNLLIREGKHLREGIASGNEGKMVGLQKKEANSEGKLQRGSILSYHYLF